MTVTGTVPQHTIPAEPPNGSTVGWGNPTSEVHIRLDEEAEGVGLPNERWFDVSDPGMDDPLSWAALNEANASSGEPYLLERKALPNNHHVPRWPLEIVGRTDDDGDHPTSAVQFSVLHLDSHRVVYGDQGWVADGRCLEDGSNAGKIQRRDITITYGGWADHYVKD